MCVWVAGAQIPLEKFHFLTRIHYLADSDGTEWGEHEGMRMLTCFHPLQISCICWEANFLNVCVLLNAQWITFCFSKAM